MVGILIKQIIVMVLMMSVGVVLAKVKMIDEDGVAQLSNLALYVATPAVVIASLDIDFKPEQLSMGILVMGFFLWLKEKKHQDWVDNFSLAGSMLAGMAAAVLFGML